MCGRLNVTDNLGVIGLLGVLGIKIEVGQVPLRFERFIRAGSDVSIVRQVAQQRYVANASWWLLQTLDGDSFKPDFKWASFNTRYDKLNKPTSAGYTAFRQSRCVIPVSGFGETEGKGRDAKYTDFKAVKGEAIALGGLCREWVNSTTGETALSCSVITLPPHEKLMPYHTKASPLMLSQHDNTIDMWLDPNLKDVTVFADLLKPNIPQRLVGCRIDKPATHKPVAEVFKLEADN